MKPHCNATKNPRRIGDKRMVPLQQEQKMSVQKPFPFRERIKVRCRLSKNGMHLFSLLRHRMIGEGRFLCKIFRDLAFGRAMPLQAFLIPVHGKNRFTRILLPKRFLSSVSNDPISAPHAANQRRRNKQPQQPPKIRRIDGASCFRILIIGSLSVRTRGCIRLRSLRRFAGLFR